MTDRYQSLRDAIAAGPTPGQWRLATADRAGEFDDLTRVCAQGPLAGDRLIVADCAHSITGNGRPVANARYVAAADPDTIRQLLHERDALREALQGLLNALPSATTHPAIKAARAALATGSQS